MPKIFSLAGHFEGGLSADEYLRVPVLAADPSSPENGSVWFNSATNEFRYRTNGLTQIINDLDEEGVRDTIAGLLVAGNNIDLVHDDAADTLTISVEQLYAADIADFQDAVRATPGVNASTLGGRTGEQIQSDTIAALSDSAPGLLDTLNEIAAALGDDPNFATTITNLINNRARASQHTLAGGALTETITHGFGTTGVSVTVYSPAGREEEYIVNVLDNDNVQIMSEGRNITAGSTVLVVARGNG